MGDVIKPEFGRPSPAPTISIPTLEQALLFLSGVHTEFHEDTSLSVHLGIIPDEALHCYYSVCWAMVRRHLGWPVGEKCFMYIHKRGGGDGI